MTFPKQGGHSAATESIRLMEQKPFHSMPSLSSSLPSMLGLQERANPPGRSQFAGGYDTLGSHVLADFLLTRRGMKFGGD